MGGREEDHLRGFESVELAARSSRRYCMPYENNLPIYVARSPKKPISDLWHSTQHYD
jgi:hypothetical protein